MAESTHLDELGDLIILLAPLQKRVSELRPHLVTRHQYDEGCALRVRLTHLIKLLEQHLEARAVVWRPKRVEERRRERDGCHGDGGRGGSVESSALAPMDELLLVADVYRDV
jgi:hypothetical protein